MKKETKDTYQLTAKDIDDAIRHWISRIEDDSGEYVEMSKASIFYNFGGDEDDPTLEGATIEMPHTESEV